MRNFKIYETTTNSSKSKKNSSDSNFIKSAHKITTDNESGARILNQEEVDEQNTKQVASLTNQLEELTQLIHGMSPDHRPNLSPKAGTGVRFSAAVALKVSAFPSCLFNFSEH